MKNIIIMSITLLTLNMVSQDKISVGLSPNNSIIETYNFYEYSNEYSLEKAFRLGPVSLKTLKDGVDTAIKWAEINEVHKKNFNKEICRFKATKKSTFDFYKKYIDQFSDEFNVNFYGFDDGNFKVVINSNKLIGDFIIIKDLTKLKDFKNLLSGKSVNNEIDDLFKK
jgi:hypothetical protein